MKSRWLGTLQYVDSVYLDCLVASWFFYFKNAFKVYYWHCQALKQASPDVVIVRVSHFVRHKLPSLQICPWYLFLSIVVAVMHTLDSVISRSLCGKFLIYILFVWTLYWTLILFVPSGLICGHMRKNISAQFETWALGVSLKGFECHFKSDQ